jgi:hypothetical protein
MNVTELFHNILVGGNFAGRFCRKFLGSGKLLLVFASKIILGSEPAEIMTIFFCLTTAGLVKLRAFHTLFNILL